MKHILIIHFNMELGGAESSLLGLLDTIDYSKYAVDLFLLSHSGEFMPLINEHVNLLQRIQATRRLHSLFPQICVTEISESHLRVVMPECARHCPVELCISHTTTSSIFIS